METTLRTDITVAEICNGFVYNQLEGKGLFGLGGKLTIQPEYQRTAANQHAQRQLHAYQARLKAPKKIPRLKPAKSDGELPHA